LTVVVDWNGRRLEIQLRPNVRRTDNREGGGDGIEPLLSATRMLRTLARSGIYAELRRLRYET
jgi:hypothetical protein